MFSGWFPSNNPKFIFINYQGSLCLVQLKKYYIQETSLKYIKMLVYHKTFLCRNYFQTMVFLFVPPEIIFIFYLVITFCLVSSQNSLKTKPFNQNILVDGTRKLFDCYIRNGYLTKETFNQCITQVRFYFYLSALLSLSFLHGTERQVCFKDQKRQCV